METRLHQFLLSCSMFVTATAPLKSQVLDWAAGFGSTGMEKISDMKLDNDRNVYLAGFFNGTVDFDPGEGTYNLTSSGDDAFILKMDSSRQIQWVKQIPGLKVASGMALAIDPMQNIVLGGALTDTIDMDPGTGTCTLTGNPGGAGFMLKLNSSGNFVWAKPLSGYGSSTVNAIDTDNSGHIYAAGSFTDTVDFDPGTDTTLLISYGNSDAFAAKFDSSGNFSWVRQVGGPLQDEATALQIDAAGHVYFAGNFLGTIDINPEGPHLPLASYGNTDIFIERLENNGIYNFYSQIGGTGADIINDMVESMGHLYCTGSFSATCDFDPDAGEYYDISAIGGKDVFVARLTAGANFLWAQALQGTGEGEGTVIGVDANGKVYAMGVFNDVTDFDPGSATANMTAAGSRDIFVERFDSDGNMEWVQKLGDTGAENACALTVTPEENLYLAGDFENTINASPAADIFNLTSAGAQDVFVLRWDQTGVGINEHENENGFLLYPNPTNGRISIELKNHAAKAKLRVMNASGETIQEQNFSGNRILADINGPSGLYFISIQEGANQSVVKLIKE